MRTTVDIEDDLLRAARHLAQDRQQSVKELLEVEHSMRPAPMDVNTMIALVDPDHVEHKTMRRTPAEIIQILTELKKSFVKSHQFWPNSIARTDNSLFEKSLIAGTRQVTDVYLLALAASHDASLLSFDRSLAWQSVRGSSARLIQRPG